MCVCGSTCVSYVWACTDVLTSIYVPSCTYETKGRGRLGVRVSFVESNRRYHCPRTLGESLPDLSFPYQK